MLRYQINIYQILSFGRMNPMKYRLLDDDEAPECIFDTVKLVVLFSYLLKKNSIKYLKFVELNTRPLHF